MDDKPKLGVNKGNAGKGRPKGAPNKTTKAVKDMILTALDKAGGEDYFFQQAQANPTAFMTLVGKVLPQDTTITGNITQTITKITLDGVRPE